jgi:hypothetical protein
VTVERDRHLEKQHIPIFSTEEGMPIDESNEQCSNASRSMTTSLEPGSKLTDDRDAQCWKQRRWRLATEEGIQIDESVEHSSNAFSSMIESLEPGSKWTAERPADRSKQLAPSRSTDAGTQIDERNDGVPSFPLKNAYCSRHESLEPDSKAIQTREWHPAKQHRPIILTGEGIQINTGRSMLRDFSS